MLIHGVELIDERDRVVSAHIKRGGFEPELVKAWRESVKPDTTAIDVGAYTGLYCIMAAQMGANAVALEPNPNNYRRLQQNIAGNNATARITCYPCAASNLNGAMAFHAGSFGGLTSAGTLHKQPRMSQQIEVQACELDSLGIPGPVSAIKIDAERHELQVLQGALRLIERDRPAILCEILESEPSGPIEALLAPLGYVGRKVEAGGWVFQC